MSTLARLGKIDVRRDEEQNVKLGQIINLLTEAGYHRARVKGLSPFDKIVGGLTWCIEVCSFDIEVDLLFHDSLSIGQKIALTEKIVKVLPLMKCPHAIEPHQIQGLDTVHIFPVVQWLVSLAVETRADQQDETRLVALNEFDRRFSRSDAQPGPPAGDSRSALRICEMRSKYGPKRLFRRDQDEAEPKDYFSRSVLTLLEYSETSALPQLKLDDENDDIGEEEMKMQNLMCEKMHREKLVVPEKDVPLQDQLEIAADVLEKRLNIRKPDSSALENEIPSLLARKDAVDNRLNVLRETEQIVKSKNSGIKEDLNRLRMDVSNEMKHQAIDDIGTLDEIVRLVEQNEQAKKAISLFKESCKAETEALNQQISEMKDRAEKEDEDIVPEELVVGRQEASEKVIAAREKLAVVSRQVESLARAIDDVPGRAELSQYQKRFAELYELIDSEHHETLQFYNMYNSLCDARRYMEKESELLDSILDNLKEALSSPSRLDQYLSQLKTIVEGIEKNRIKLEGKRAEALAEQTEYLSGLDKQRELQSLYSKALDQFSKEVALNARLQEQCSS